MQPRARWHAMRQYNVTGKKFAKPPKTWSERYAALLNDKTHVHNVKQITLNWSKKGPNQAGVRFFKYHKVPPLKYWNPDVVFQFNKDLEKTVTASVHVELEDGSSTTIEAGKLTADEILEQVVMVAGERQHSLWKKE